MCLGKKSEWKNHITNRWHYVPVYHKIKIYKDSGYSANLSV